MIDRSIQPDIVVPKDIKLVGHKQTASPKGVPIYKIENEGYNVVRFSLVFNAGVTKQTQPFLASCTMNNLTEGSSRRTAKEIADFMDFYGLFYDASIDLDYSIITICSLKKFTKEALQVIEDLMSPVFPEYELDIYKNKRKQYINLQRAKVSYVAQEQFQNVLYGDDTPHGRLYDIKDFDSLSVDRLKEFFEKQYTRNNLFVVISGDSTEEDIKNIGEIVDKLPLGACTTTTPPTAALTREFYLEKEKAVQSALKIGRVLFNRQHEDFIGMQIVAKILGGYFGSRLISNLREDKGYTYGIYSSLVNTDLSGYFVISGEVISQYTDDALEQIDYELDRLRSELVGSEELEMVKSVMIGEIMRVLDGPFGVADVLIENIQNGESNSYLNDMILKINEITSEEIRNLADKYLQKEDLSTVIIGKR